MSGQGERKVVCVTGASGYVASWLVKLLLQRDYTVRATVRNLCDPKKTEHLKALEGAEERLELFEADLSKEGSFDTVVHGCAGVFHTASPVIMATTNPQEELIDPAVNGTLNVLRSCAKTGSIQRVVLTSSTAAVIYNGRPISPDVVVDETWFSDPDICRENKGWYSLSKTLAEEAAWNFAQENGIDLVVMNPGLVLGPLLQPTLNTTSQFVMDMLKGTTRYPHYQCVDVRDVGHAHILGFENSSATGRYLLVAKTLTPSYLLHLLHMLFPSIVDAPAAGEAENSIGDVTSRKTAESLGVSFMDVEVSFKDTIESLMEKNFLHFRERERVSRSEGEGEGEGEGRVVCVTGASGYVASWLVKLLLQRGYTVRATVRNLCDPKKTEHLKALQGAEERLELFEADLSKEGSFDSVVHGCAGVFHTASPVIMSTTNPQEDLIDPAVNGTLNVLRSCAKNESVRRVVLTSSTTATTYNGRPTSLDVVIDESWFSDPAICRENKEWYSLSKTLAEEAAWKFAQESGLDLVVMNPGLVIGPLLQPALNTSSQYIMEVLKGQIGKDGGSTTTTTIVEKTRYPYCRCVDVRDVGHAHILGMENSSASGRYILVAKTLTPSYLLHLFHKLFPSTVDAPISGAESPFGDLMSRKKAESLGMSFMDVEVSFKDTIESLKEKNFLHF